MERNEKWIFYRQFQDGTCPNVNISSFIVHILFTCIKHVRKCTQHIVYIYLTIFNYFALSATTLHVVWYIFIEIDKTLIKNCKMVQAPTWKIPHSMVHRLCSLYIYHETFVIFNSFALSQTPRYLVRYILFWKRMIFPQTLQDSTCPNLKDSSLNYAFSYAPNMRNSIFATVLHYLRLPFAFKCTSLWTEWGIHSTF